MLLYDVSIVKTYNIHNYCWHKMVFLKKAESQTFSMPSLGTTALFTGLRLQTHPVFPQAKRNTLRSNDSSEFQSAAAL